jgi:ketosteroid isomerase-like protein
MAEQPAKSRVPESGPIEKPAPSSDLAVDEFFNQLQSDMRRPDLSQEAISAAFQAIQKLALDSGAEEAGQAEAAKSVAGSSRCSACNTPNRNGARFCSGCGVPVQESAEQAGHFTAGAGASPQPAGEHHYHHHYHHHYLPASSGMPQTSVSDFRPAPSGIASREALKVRGPSGTPSLSRAEAAVRRMTQDWAQACNMKQLDDLVELYATDALMLRSNLPPIRGTAAIREFYFAALDAGLGDAEFEPLRVELFGDIAFEAGRFKTLAPVAVGKRREERGKYVILFVRQQAGDWKAMVDCWSSDLSPAVSPDVPSASAPLLRPPRKI